MARRRIIRECYRRLALRRIAGALRNLPFVAAAAVGEITCGRLPSGPKLITSTSTASCCSSSERAPASVPAGKVT